MASRLRFSVLCACLPVWAGAADNEPVIELAPVTATRSARSLDHVAAAVSVIDSETIEQRPPARLTSRIRGRLTPVAH